MDILNYVVGLIQDIHEAEVAVSVMRDQLDVAWDRLLAEGKLLPSDSARQSTPLLLEWKNPVDATQFPETAEGLRRVDSTHLL